MGEGWTGKTDNSLTSVDPHTGIGSVKACSEGLRF